MRPSPPKTPKRSRKPSKDSRHLQWKSAKPSTLNRMKRPVPSQNNNQRSKLPMTKRLRKERRRKKKRRKIEAEKFRSDFEIVVSIRINHIILK